jgi:hypothetical protein
MQDPYCAPTRDHRDRSKKGHPADIPVSMLRALEENLHSFEKHRHLILDQVNKVVRND